MTYSILYCSTGGHSGIAVTKLRWSDTQTSAHASGQKGKEKQKNN